MHRCLDLADQGMGFTAPNPMVGCVIVHGDKIIAEGFHRQYGGPHAEVMALNAVADADRHLLPEATLYVSLEPCNHFGKTPPCTEKILASGIQHVVVGMQDPNPLVAGSGIQRLRDAGLAVEVGVLEQEGRKLNQAFITYFEAHRPMITLKWAQSADGFLAAADGKPVHLSNQETDMLVHRLRATHMAILVGGKTVETDDPSLTTRLWPGRNPVRVIVDTKGAIKPGSKIYSNAAETLVCTTVPNLQLPYGETALLQADGNIPQQVIDILFSKKINSVLIEGGSATLKSFIAAGLWDTLLCIQTPHILGSGIPAPDVSHMVGIYRQVGDNRILQVEKR